MALVGFRIINAHVKLEVILDFLRGQGRPIEKIQDSGSGILVNGGNAEGGEEPAGAGQGVNRPAQV